MAVLLSTDAFSLIDDDLIVPFDTLATAPPTKDWLGSFYPAFLKNGQIAGHLWGVPFQRSTIVLYWNKDAFRCAGLDPGPSAGDMAGTCRIRREAYTATMAAMSPGGACKFLAPASPIGCSRHWRPRQALRSPMRTAP